MTENNENKEINPVNEDAQESATVNDESQEVAPETAENKETIESIEKEENISTENEPPKEKSVKEGKSSFNLLKEVWEWFYTILIALIVVVIIKGFVFDIVRVSGPSMNPTLIDNDRLFVTKLNYSPKFGDIVILDSNYKDREKYYEQYEEENNKELNWLSEKILYNKLPTNLKHHYYVKRIIGMPGDTIDIKDGVVYVNEKPLDETYVSGPIEPRTIAVPFPQTVEEGHVFVLGDNRGNSTDSRSPSLGQVPIEALVGKSQFRIWPFNAMGKTE